MSKYMKRTTKHSIRMRCERGNAMLEFALCSSVLFLLTCGVCDFGRVFKAANTAVGAASAGLAYASVGPHNWSDFASIQTAALNDTGNYPGAIAVASNSCTCSVGGTPVSCPATCQNGTPETYIQVLVAIPFQPLFNYPGLPNPMNITQVARARVQ